MTGQGRSMGVSGRAQAYPLGSQANPLRRGFITDRNTPQHPHLPSQTIPQVKTPDLEVLDWRGYTWSAVVMLVGCTAKFSKTMLEAAYGREMNIKFYGNIVSMPVARSLKTRDICVTKLHILEWAFIVTSTRCTCVMILLFNHLLDMPHLSGGWIILAKEKFSLTGM